MLEPIKIQDYVAEYDPKWSTEMPEGCPPEDVEIAHNHVFYRMSKYADHTVEEDWISYYDLYPGNEWGQNLPMAKGLSVINSGKSERLGKLKNFKGKIKLTLNPQDGVVKQTGNKPSHYTWWSTINFDKDNVTMI